MTPDASPWGGHVLRPLPGGARSRLWLVGRGNARFVLRATTASEPSLHWQDRAQALAERADIAVARLVPSASGALTASGFTLEPFLQGLPAAAQDLATLGPRLARWHAATRHLPTRPGVPASAATQGLPANLARRCRLLLPPGPQSAIHGDLHPGNLLLLPSGQIALIDWEESRRDATAIDHLALGQSPTPAALALEVIACWRTEPARARRLARRLALWV